MKLSLLSIALLALPASLRANDALIYETDFEDPAEVKRDWREMGGNKAQAIHSDDKAASGSRSLAIVDKDPSQSSAWQSQPFLLSAAALERGQVTVSWKVLHLLSEGQTMRISVLFPGSTDAKSTAQFPKQGASEEWDQGTFTEERHDIPIPSGAGEIQIKLSSISDKGADGEIYLDDLKIE